MLRPPRARPATGGAHNARETKIGHSCRAALVEKNVPWFEVAVDHIPTIQESCEYAGIFQYQIYTHSPLSLLLSRKQASLKSDFCV